MRVGRGERTVYFDALVDDGEDAVPSAPLCPFCAASESTPLQPTEQESPPSLAQADMVPFRPPPFRRLVLCDVGRVPQAREPAYKSRVLGVVIGSEAFQEVVGGVSASDEDEVEVRVDKEGEQERAQFGAVDVERVLDKGAQSLVASFPARRVCEHLARRDTLVHPAASSPSRGWSSSRPPGSTRSIPLCKVFQSDCLALSVGLGSAAVEVGLESEGGLVVTAFREVVEDGAVVGVRVRPARRSTRLRSRHAVAPTRPDEADEDELLLLSLSLFALTHAPTTNAAMSGECLQQSRL